MIKQFMIKRCGISWCVVDTNTDKVIERCHNLATAKMYAVRFNTEGSLPGLQSVIVDGRKGFCLS